MSNISYQKALAALEIEFRALSEADAPAYKEMRLKALNTEGGIYTANKEEETARTMTEWKDVCKETTHRTIFAAFAGNQLIAATSVAEENSSTAKWTSTYIEPQFRRAGIAENLFRMCEHWSAIRGHDEVIFTIRADNARSRQIQESNGAVFTHEAPARFADGSVAPLRYYKKSLHA